MRHPHRRDFRKASEKRVIGRFDAERSAAIFARAGGYDFASAVLCEPLGTIADAEEWYDTLDPRQVRLRRIGIPYGRRTAGQDHSLDVTVYGRDLVEWPYLTIYSYFAHPPGYELGVLRTEIQNQYLVIHLLSNWGFLW